MKGPGRKNKSRKASIWYNIGQWTLWLSTVGIITGLFAACFGGNINPAQIKGISLMILMLPLWIILAIIITVLDALWCKKALPFCVLAFIACANAIWNYCPLNIFGPSMSKYADCPKLTLLTYNVATFYNFTENYPGGVNPTVSYIIRTNADVVCLQETEINLSTPYELYHITPAQIDSINKLYPYIVVYGGFLTVLSKYPVEAIHTPPIHYNPARKWNSYPIGVFRLDIDGMPVTLFNVHLQSYGLSSYDKSLYQNIADGKEIKEAADGSIKSSIKDIKTQIFNKVQTAAVKRANEAEVLCRYINRFGGKNVIVAGDFNDVPGCYTLRRLADVSMREVYPEVGFGPMITFHADKFYFRIDHVLYRGDFVPLKMERGSLKSSDHYPLLTTFAIKRR